MLKSKFTGIVALLIALMVCLAIFSGCQSNEKMKIVLADGGWDSIRVHNEIARFIIENGYGYETSVIPGTTASTFAGFEKGDINVYMEVWTDNIPDIYKPLIESGDVVEVSTNFDDNAQGLYVPTYVIEGDEERDIEPMAPDLKTVEDLAKYAAVFTDPEDPSKGRIVGSPPVWGEVDKILRAKMKAYDLEDKFTYFSPGSDTALASSMVGAIKQGEPWVGYYWEPTWIIGKYDVTMLSEDPYSEEKWNEESNFACLWPAVNCAVAVHKDVTENAPELVDFLENYKTSSALTSEALAYMRENEAEPPSAAKYFLEEHEEIWTEWIPSDIADKVKEALDME